MEPAIQIYIGGLVSIGSEAKALCCLYDDLYRLGVSATLLVNFHVEGRQVDCVVVTDRQAVMLDFKNLNGPIKGGVNGPWMLRDYGGAEKAYEGENPYQEVLAAKFALANGLKKFHRERGCGIAPEKGQFVRLLNAAVCVIPGIAAGSSITKGDFKCRVWSYSEALSEIITRELNQCWMMKEWARFAEHLGLENASLQAAISPEYRRAEKTLTAYSQALREALSAEDFPDLPGSTISLPTDQHALVVGPSGIGKTVHLKKHALGLTDSNRLVIFCSGRHYTDSLDRLLARSVAPFSRKTAIHLIEAAGKCGWSIHLLVDGIDGFAANREEDITNGLAAFAVRYGARVVVSSINGINLPPTIQATVLTMPRLSEDQKLAIFHFHADTDRVPPAGFLTAFETAHDIMVAAKSAAALVTGDSRADYYAACILESLPQENKITAGKLLRHLANHLHRTFVRSIEFREFEEESTSFLSSIGGPLKIADALTTLPQISTSRGSFSFKHDLWQDYLGAEWMLSSTRDPVALSAELSKPINRRLLPHAIGRIDEPKVIGMVFEKACDEEIIADGFSGGLGAASKAYLEDKRRQIWDDLFIDAADFEIQIASVKETNEGRRIMGWPDVTSKKKWTVLERNVAGWISGKLHRPEIAREFIKLLENSACALWNASEGAAQTNKLSARQVFGSTLHVLFYFSGPKIPISAFGMFRFWEQSRWNRRAEGDPNGAFRNQLLDRLANCREEAKGALLFCLATILRHDKCPDMDMMSRVFHMGWEQRLAPVRNELLEMIEWHGADFAQRSPTLATAVKDKLEAVLGNDPISNTFIFDALNALGAVPPPVTREDALAELRKVIDPASKKAEDLLVQSGLYPSQDSEPVSMRSPLASYASALVSKFWEDIFQNVYWEAYEALDEAEKVRLMNLAAINDDIVMGEPFILRELIRLCDPSSIEAFRFHAERVRIDLSSQQDAIAMWCLGIIGCARLGEPLPTWRGGTGIGSRAWYLIRELLYKDHIGEGLSEEAQDLWIPLRSDTIGGAADVFFHLHSAEAMENKDEDFGCWRHLLGYQEHIRYIMEYSLLHLDHLISISKWNRPEERASFIMQVLGDIGNQSSVSVLRQFIEHQTLGGDAVAAIEKINKH